MSSADGAGEQLAFIRETVRRARPRAARGLELAAELPVARVLVDKGVLSLDQYFDYAVPAAMAEEARPGVRVRVRFGARVGASGRREGGALHDGFLVERLAASDYPGPLAPLARVVSPEPVLTPALLRLCRAVADRYAGTLADVLQLAVPPRHARAEAVPSPAPLPSPPHPTRAAGPATRRARPSSPRWPPATPRARSGRRCPAPAGRTRSPAPSPPPWPAAAAPWSCCPTAARWPGSTRRSPNSSAPAGTPYWPPRPARRTATGAGWPSAAAPSAP
ncbi:hypothetical protein GCM10025734_69980 [Kitasatospora paranensis]